MIFLRRRAARRRQKGSPGGGASRAAGGCKRISSLTSNSCFFCSLATSGGEDLHGREVRRRSEVAVCRVLNEAGAVLHTQKAGPRCRFCSEGAGVAMGFFTARDRKGGHEHSHGDGHMRAGPPT